MASVEDGTLKDISYLNLIQIVQARTLLGFVPNFASGTGISFDRTEPQIGAFVVREIYTRWRDAWVVDLLFPALLSWNMWVWTHRRGEGVLAGADGHADLIVLGSDPTDPPCGIGGFNNMQAARYESGLDNSPMYDLEGAAFAGYGYPDFDENVTHHMSLYDVGMTALFLSDTEALIALAEVAGRFDIVPELQQRFQRVQAAMNSHMWDPATGMYTNVLYNGSFYSRFAPTSFFPLMSGSATDAQADAMMATFTSPLGFCFNRSHTPDANAAMLVQWCGPRARARAPPRADPRPSPARPLRLRFAGTTASTTTGGASATTARARRSTPPSTSSASRPWRCSPPRRRRRAPWRSTRTSARPIATTRSSRAPRPTPAPRSCARRAGAGARRPRRPASTAGPP